MNSAWVAAGFKTLALPGNGESRSSLSCYVIGPCCSTALFCFSGALTSCSTGHSPSGKVVVVLFSNFS